MNQPLVSILMPSYNAEKFLAEAIESVLQSSYSNWELIIVDDKSKDATLAIAKSYEAKDARISVYLNAVNLGDYPNRNKTAGYAKGKYLKYLDNDDVIYKYSLDYMVEAMERFPDAGLALGFIRVDDDRPYPQVYLPEETFREQYLGTGFLGYGPSAAIIRKDCFDLLGGFSGEAFLGDQQLWLNLALQFPVIKLQPALVWYRRHENQESTREVNDWKSRNRRYHLTIDFLNKSRSYYSAEEFNAGLKKLKRNHARSILRSMLTIKNPRLSFDAWRGSGLTITELLLGFKPYIK
jgi:glycosyltransferase involved in cell wall biosynthesis